MDPVLSMLILALLVFVVGTMLLVMPIYTGCYASIYWMHLPDGTEISHPAEGQFWDYQWVLANYQELHQFWLQTKNSIGFELFAPPFIGACVGVVLLVLFYQYLRSLFTIDNL